MQFRTQNYPGGEFTLPLFSIAKDPRNPNDRGCTNQSLYALTNGGQKKIRLMERHYFYYKYHYRYVEITIQEFNLMSIRITDTLKIYTDAINENSKHLQNPLLSQAKKAEIQNNINGLSQEWKNVNDLDVIIKSDLAKFYKNDMPTYDIIMGKVQIALIYHLIEYVYIVDEIQKKQNRPDLNEFANPFVGQTVDQWMQQNGENNVIRFLEKLASFFDWRVEYIPEQELM